MLSLQVRTLNTIRNVLEGELWNSSYPLVLSQSGRPGVQFLIQVRLVYCWYSRTFSGQMRFGKILPLLTDEHLVLNK